MISTSPARPPRRALVVLVATMTLIVTAVLWLAPRADTAPLRVVATTSILADVTQRIGGSDARVQTLIPRGADPHQFSPSARQAAELRRADVVIANGANLEEGLARALRSARANGANIVEVAGATNLRPGPGGRPDPHFWTDPTRMERAAQVIGRALAAQTDARTGRRIGLRGRGYRAALIREDRRVRRAVARVPPSRRVLVTNHHVLGYFAHRYRFRVAGAIIPSTTTLASASAADLADLSRVIRRHRVRAIFVDATSPRRLAEVLAREARVQVRVVSLYSESLGPQGSAAGTYLGMVRVNTARIVAGLNAR